MVFNVYLNMLEYNSSEGRGLTHELSVWGVYLNPKEAEERRRKELKRLRKDKDFMKGKDNLDIWIKREQVCGEIED